MSENQAADTSSKKAKAEVTTVTMEDGREVGFAGNRKMVKDYNLTPNGVEVVIDFRNGKTVRFTCDDSMQTPDGQSLLLISAGHGLVQKLGDEAASEKDVDDAYLAIEELASRLSKGEWTVQREGGGFSGASVVIRAIMEASGKSQEEVKAFLQKKLDDAKARGENLTRPALYASFRNPNSKVGQIVKRLEDEKATKGNAVDADEALGELTS